MSLSQSDPLLVRARELLEKELPEAPTLWLKPPGDTPLHRSDSAFYHPWYPEHQRLLRAGWQPMTESESWPQIAIFGGRQKEENAQLVRWAQAACQAEGRVFFVIPNDYGAKSAVKQFGLEACLEADLVGRKSRLLLLRSTSGESEELVTVSQNSDGFYSTPGLFSPDKIDTASKLLARVLKAERLGGPVADLGGGWGYLSSQLPTELEIHFIEADERGLTCARKNLEGRNTNFYWADVSQPQSLPETLLASMSTVVTNPPFHTHKKAEPILGGSFLAVGHRLLRPGGTLYMVGNTHLGYHRLAATLFSEVQELARESGFSVLKGKKR